jgi:hypothetical protein
MKYIIMPFFVLMSCGLHAANMVEQFQVPLGRQLTFSATTTSVQALVPNQNRGYLMIQNSCASSDTVTVNLGAKETAGTGVQLSPCSSYEFSKVPTNSVWLKSASGSQTVIIVEGNIAQGEAQ